MTQAPNRDVSLTVTHPHTRAAPGDPPLNPLVDLKGWKVSHALSGSNIYDVVAALLPPTQNTLIMPDYPPGAHNFKIEWIDQFDQVSEPTMASTVVPKPAPPSNGDLVDIHLV